MDIIFENHEELLTTMRKKENRMDNKIKLIF